MGAPPLLLLPRAHAPSLSQDVVEYWQEYLLWEADGAPKEVLMAAAATVASVTSAASKNTWANGGLVVTRQREDVMVIELLDAAGPAACWGNRQSSFWCFG